MNRSSGILLPISSLPSNYGIGTLGKAAYDFADFLEKAGQKVWQVLPLNPTSYGDSPYQSPCSSAGNPYFIDLDLLIEEGLLTKSEVLAVDFGDTEDCIDYEKLYNGRFKLLRIAMKRDVAGKKFEDFKKENQKWLLDYAFFMALKEHFGMKSWIQWEDDIRLKKPSTVEKYKKLLEQDIEFYCYIQFLFFKQWKALKEYVNSKDISIVGDVPIYVAMDSADVYANPKNFKLDEELIPTEVSGVPPDYFSENGQLWGNPLYDWDYIRQTGYKWWIERIGAVLELFDIIRIDHFRGIESFWSVPYGEKTAKKGKWNKGPGMELINVINGWFKGIKIIAEDLGYMTQEVKDLLTQSGYPGMKVLQFAFDAREPSDYLPHTYSPNCVVYTGTHDNTTVASWFNEANSDDVEYAKKYLGLNHQEGYNWGFIRGALGSVANLAIAQMQDYLNLGIEARMNEPSTLGGNWQWRVKKSQLTTELANKIKFYTEMYGR